MKHLILIKLLLIQILLDIAFAGRWSGIATGNDEAIGFAIAIIVFSIIGSLYKYFKAKYKYGGLIFIIIIISIFILLEIMLGG